MKIGWLFDPQQVALTLVTDPLRIDEHDPRFRRQIIGQVTRRGVLAGAEHRNLDLLQRLVAPLRRDLERAERLDLVVEQLNAYRQAPVRRKDVKDPAAMRKFTGQLDRARRMKAAL